MTIQFSIHLFSLCYHTRGYPKSHYFSNHLPALQYRNLIEIYEEIAKRYDKHEIKRLSKRKNKGAIRMDVGRHFKLDVKNRFLMLLIYYRLYITYTLGGFLFDLDQDNICRDIQKIEY